MEVIISNNYSREKSQHFIIRVIWEKTFVLDLFLKTKNQINKNPAEWDEKLANHGWFRGESAFLLAVRSPRPLRGLKATWEAFIASLKRFGSSAVHQKSLWGQIQMQREPFGVRDKSTKYIFFFCRVCTSVRQQFKEAIFCILGFSITFSVTYLFEHVITTTIHFIWRRPRSPSRE